MVELGEEGRALLELARDNHNPTDEDRARVRMVLAQRLGTAAGFGAVASLASSEAAAATTAAGAGGTSVGAGVSAGAALGSTLATKLIAVIVIGTAVGGGATAVHRLRSPAAPRPSVAALTPTRVDRVAPSAIVGPAGVAPESEQRAVGPAPPSDAVRPEATDRWRPDAEAHAARGARAHVQPTSSRGAAAARPASAPRPPEEPDRSPAAPAAAAAPSERGNDRVAPPEPGTATPGLAKEARLVHDGVAALRAGEPARALALFDVHATFFPHGALAEERAAERVLALAELGRREEAHVAADEFWRAHPASPLGKRLRKRLRALDGEQVTNPAPGGVRE